MIIGRFVAETPISFSKDMHIMEAVVLPHETIYELQSTKGSEVLLKIDFEKAYDKVNWPFLYQMWQAKGFGGTWGRG